MSRMPVPKLKPRLKPHLERKPEPQENLLLAALSPAVQTRLFPHLELVPLSLRALLYDAGRPMSHVYFPTDSIISLQHMLEDGGSTAISVIGNEGLKGLSVPVRARSIASATFSAVKARARAGAGPLARAKVSPCLTTAVTIPGN